MTLLTASFLWGAANNLLVLLGAAFLLSRALAVLGGRPAWARTVLMSGAFAGTAIVSMLAWFPITDGIVGDLRNAVIAIAAIIGGPIVALVTGVAAAAYRIAIGGYALTGVVGIAVATALAIGFWRTGKTRRPVHLVVFGLVLAIVNAALPLVGGLINPAVAGQAWDIAAAILVTAGICYPLTILIVGGFLRSEIRRIDVAEALRSDNARLAANERRFAEVFDLSTVAMAWGDITTGRLIRTNAQYRAFTGYSEEELLMMDMAELSPPEDRERDGHVIRRFVAGDMASTTGERRYLRKDGRVVFGLRTLSSVREAGEPRYLFAIILDITEQKRDRAEIAYLAEHDPLTGLFNRRVVYDRVSAAATTIGDDAELAVLYLDLDDFKEINDTVGHHVGDIVLTQLAERLKACAGNADVVARLSGDGFAIVHPMKRGADDLEAFAQRILGSVTTSFWVENSLVSVGASMGIAVAPRDGKRAAELFRKADIAVQKAKSNGRGAFRFFAPDMEAALLARTALKADLANALAGKELFLEYQPIVDLASGQITAFEALIRWRHPQRGLIAPADFIPVAEETGLIAEIGDWVLQEACAEAVTWPGRIRLAVNVSPRQFDKRGLALDVASSLISADLNPRRLELEITESVLFEDSEAHLAILNDLRAFGVGIAIDDFGTGYSALGYVHRFPIDKIKIDRMFVRGLPDGEESKAVVGSIVGLGRALGMRVLAEGVETEEQLRALRDCGCDEARGFLFSKAVPANRIPELLDCGREIRAADKPRSGLEAGALGEVLRRRVDHAG